MIGQELTHPAVPDITGRVQRGCPIVRIRQSHHAEVEILQVRIRGRLCQDQNLFRFSEHFQQGFDIG